MGFSGHGLRGPDIVGEFRLDKLIGTGSNIFFFNQGFPSCHSAVCLIENFLR
jgi:hypothetical protein